MTKTNRKTKSLRMSSEFENLFLLSSNDCDNSPNLTKSKKKKDNECSICLEKMCFLQRTYRTKHCRHKFHFQCLKKHCDSFPKRTICGCPLCRTSIEEDRFMINNDGKLAYADWDEYKRIVMQQDINSQNSTTSKRGIGDYNGNMTTSINNKQREVSNI
eukprot:Awhi_evm1s14850